MNLTKEQAVQFLEYVTGDYEPGYNKVTNEHGYIWKGNENYREEIGVKTGEELFEQFIKSLE
jgi:hypothetical protein